MNYELLVLSVHYILIITVTIIIMCMYIYIYIYVLYICKIIYVGFVPIKSDLQQPNWQYPQVETTTAFFTPSNPRREAKTPRRLHEHLK